MKWVIFLFALCFGSAFAQAPSLVTYQGRLVGPDGVVISDGTRALTFRLFDAPTGGTLIWARQYDAPVVDGRFSVVLGAPGKVVESPSAPAVNDLAYAFAGEDRYLEISVDDGSPLLPRQQMGSVPYAIKALHGVPAGTVVAFAGTVAPVGWLLCDGSEKEIVKYPALYSAIRDVWGTASAGKFRLPDLRGRTVVGVGQGQGLTGRSLAQTIGAETHTLTMDQMPAHNHGGGNHSHNFTYGRTVDNWGSFVVRSGQDNGAGAGTWSSGEIIAWQGSNQAHNIMQPSLAFNYLIKE